MLAWTDAFTTTTASHHNNTTTRPATWQMLAWTDAFNLDVAGLTNLLEDLDTLQEIAE